MPASPALPPAPADLERLFATLHAALGAEVTEHPPGRVLRVSHPALVGSAANYAVLLAPSATAHAPAAAAWLAGRGRAPAVVVPQGVAGRRPGGHPALVATGLRPRQRLLALAWDAAGVATAAAGVAGVAAVAAVPGLHIHRLPLSLIEHWVNLMLSAFRLPNLLRVPARSAWTGVPERLRQGQRLSLYLAEVDGQPAGTGCYLYTPGRGCAVLAGGAVLPGFRRRGIGRALLARRLADAHRDGAAQAACQTRHPGVVRSWRQLGGMVAYPARVWT